MNEKENKDEKSNEERYKKYAILAVLIGFLVYVIIDYTVPGLGYIQDILLEFLKWFGSESIALFLSVQALCFLSL